MPEQDNYIEYYYTDQNRLNKRLTRTVFREQSERKLFLKIFSRMREKLKRGNQFDVARELKKHFKQAENDGLFEYLFVYGWNKNPHTGLAEISDEVLKKTAEKVEIQKQKRYEFLLKIGFKFYPHQQSFPNDIFSREVFFRYFSIASPEAIVQMKKRLSKKTKRS